MLKNKIDTMLKAWADNAESLDYKRDLFVINEGALRDFVVAALAETLGRDTKSFQFAVQRIPPINVMQKIISKLSQIYNKAPMRTIVDGSMSDQDLLAYYLRVMQFDAQMDVANEFYNLTKIAFVMPIYNPDTGRHGLRSWLPHQFLPFSSDISDRTRMTEVMLYQGTISGRKVFYAYSDDEVIKFDEDGREYPTESGGVNIFGKIPGVYFRKSRNLLYPKDDTDMKAMAVLVPTMLADLNLASMFSCFSILYGIDIADEERKYSPNAFWHFKSDPDNDKKPVIGSIKPEADIGETINLIVSELSLWLNSKGIKPGSIGSLTIDNAASGISKLVDEMDTFEDREKQAMVFAQGESAELWPLIMHYMHPVWVSQGMPTNKLFTPTASVSVQFPTQQALKSRSERVLELAAEVKEGFMSRRRAIETLNASLGQDEIDKLLAEINDEATVWLGKE